MKFILGLLRSPRPLHPPPILREDPECQPSKDVYYHFDTSSYSCLSKKNIFVDITLTFNVTKMLYNQHIYAITRMLYNQRIYAMHVEK